jgi:hypothetical protein
MLAERIFALAVSAIGLTLGGYFLWTGKLTLGDRPWLKLVSIAHATRTTARPVTARICGAVIVGLSVWLAVLAIVE